MSSISIAAVAFLCIFGGSLIGMYLRTKLKEHHLGADTKDVVKVGVGLIATMSALVLGLLVASAKSSFDTQKSEVGQMSANVIILDRALAHYGSDAKEIRDLLPPAVERMIGQLWPSDGAQVQPNLGSEILFDKLQGLSPKNDSQRTVQAQALKTAIDLAQIRWLLFAQKSSAISMPFLVVVIFWVTITFMSFGLYAPKNVVSLVTLLICALSVSAALYLVLELDRPFDGFIQISNEPLRKALEQLGR
jgi:hypothetical protein